jgi:hypothetical protein
MGLATTHTRHNWGQVAGCGEPRYAFGALDAPSLRPDYFTAEVVKLTGELAEGLTAKHVMPAPMKPGILS